MGHMTFGERLCEELHSLGISQAELARRLDVHPTAVAQWVRDAWPPTFGNLFRIAEALDTTPSRLLEGVNLAA